MPVIDMNEYRRACDGPDFLARLAGYRPEIIAEARCMRGRVIFMRARAHDMRAAQQIESAQSWDRNAAELESSLLRMLTHHAPVPVIPAPPSRSMAQPVPLAAIEIPLSPVRVVAPVETANALRRLQALAALFLPRQPAGRPG